MIDLEDCINLCKQFEGFKSEPYLCPAGVPTIGYGSTRYLDGRKVTLQDPPISQEDAETLLLATLTKVYTPGVLRCCPSLIMYNARLNAIDDFTYNLGVGRLQTSTLARLIRAGKWEDAAKEFKKWNKAGGKALPGLTKRRIAETILFNLQG